MAFTFSSSWSMSVMLGTVVETPGRLMTHFNAASMAPGWESFWRLGSPGLRLRVPPAITFMATTPMPALEAAAMACSVAGSMVKLKAERTTSKAPFSTIQGSSCGWPRWPFHGDTRCRRNPS